MSLSPAATIVLARAADHPDRLLQFDRKLPAAARHKMIDALLRDRLITETEGDYRAGTGATLNLDSETGLLLTTLALTGDGLRAIGRTPTATVAGTTSPTAPPTAPHTAPRVAPPTPAATTQTPRVSP